LVFDQPEQRRFELEYSVLLLELMVNYDEQLEVKAAQQKI